VEQVTFVESKEAETAARQAKHRISSGLHNKVFIALTFQSVLFVYFLVSTTRVLGVYLCDVDIVLLFIYIRNQKLIL
jgi:hypothetical protein